LDGDFDEEENKRAFEAARQEWMGADSGNGNGSGASTKGSRVQLVHDPDYSPAEMASSSGQGGGSGGGAGGLLDGPSFNERESAREFQEARKAWIQSLAEDSVPAKKAPAKKSTKAPAAQAASADSWNPTVAQSGDSILFPSESDSDPTAPPPRVSTALRQAQTSLEKSEKLSCYSCYKLFYADAAVKSDQFEGKPFCSAECVAKEVEGAQKARAKRKTEVGGLNAPSAVLTTAAESVGAASPSSASSAVAADAASFDSDIPRVSSSPEPEPEGEEEGGEEEEGEEAERGSTPDPATASTAASSGSAAASSASAAPLSRPTTASTRPVLDTSVILKAAPGSAAPAVEFPSDEEEEA
jgi:hypothetical protein